MFVPTFLLSFNVCSALSNTSFAISEANFVLLFLIASVEISQAYLKRAVYFRRILG